MKWLQAHNSNYEIHQNFMGQLDDVRCEHVLHPTYPINRHKVDKLNYQNLQP